MNEQPPSTLQKTLALFDAPGEDDRDLDCEWLVDLLAVAKTWTTANEILKTVGHDLTENHRRRLRALSNASAGRVCGGQKGYKLTVLMTQDEYQAWLTEWHHAKETIRERLEQTDRVFRSKR